MADTPAPPMSQSGEEINLDATEVLNKLAQYDQHLVQRVIAEMQRDKVIELLNVERARRGDDEQSEKAD